MEDFFGGFGLGEAFDGDDVGAVELGDEGDAGGDGTVIEAFGGGIRAADEDGAGSAVAFRADDFGAGEVGDGAEVVGEGEERLIAADFEALAVDVQEDMIPHEPRSNRDETDVKGLNALGKSPYTAAQANRVSIPYFSHRIQTQ